MGKSSKTESRKSSKVNDTLFVIGTVIATAAVATFLGYLVGLYGIQKVTSTGPVPRVKNVEVSSTSLTKVETPEVKPSTTTQGAKTASSQPSQAPAEPTSRSSTGSRQLYRVQVGAFSQRANADSLAQRLKKELGLDAIIVGSGPYRVQVGAFGDRANAERLQKELQSKGYEAIVVQ